MKLLSKLFGDVEINRDLILLLVIGGMYSLSIALSNTFVNVYLWKQSGDFIDLGVYNLSIVIAQPLTFILAGRWAKKIDRVIVLRLGVSFLAVFFLSVLFIGENASDLIVVLGGLLGIGYGFYWLAFNVLTFEITEPETRDFFNGFLGVLTSLAGMIGPITAGIIISSFEKFTGYTIIFAVSLGLFAGAVVLSFFIRRRQAEGHYWLTRVWKERKRNFNWKMITTAHFFQGLREGTFIFMITVIVFITTNSELALGKFGLVNSSTAFVTYFLAAKLIKKDFRKTSILIGGILLYAAIYIILFDTTYTKILLYAFVIAIGYPLLLVPYASLTYDVIGKAWNAARMRIEYIVIKELFLNAGRAFSILLFLATVYFFNDDQAIIYLLMVIGAGHAVIYLFIRKIEFEKSVTNESCEHALEEHKRNECEGGS
ncbi:MFS transporter [Bacillus sp. HMF5848]|uniref:MFS transporter n=1 Tax=Bacillus sp. HMF5848 TaxID=2495421 RepID=UPI000F772100|nr:MFS transporter [Bacillus sp. HMF5848]RSK27857.1 MFS transporter [Bacillus sp. HMF5848]